MRKEESAVIKQFTNMITNILAKSTTTITTEKSSLPSNTDGNADEKQSPSLMNARNCLRENYERNRSEVVAKIEEMKDRIELSSGLSLDSKNLLREYKDSSLWKSTHVESSNAGTFFDHMPFETLNISSDIKLPIYDLTSTICQYAIRYEDLRKIDYCNLRMLYVKSGLLCSPNVCLFFDNTPPAKKRFDLFLQYCQQVASAVDFELEIGDLILLFKAKKNLARHDIHRVNTQETLTNIYNAYCEKLKEENQGKKEYERLVLRAPAIFSAAILIDLGYEIKENNGVCDIIL